MELIAKCIICMGLIVFIIKVILAMRPQKIFQALAEKPSGWFQWTPVFYIFIYIAVTCLALVTSLGRFTTIINDAYVRLIGISLYVVGVVINQCGGISIGSFFSFAVLVRRKHKVVSSGIYRFIRHPIYLGSILQWLGIGFGLLNKIALIIAVFSIVLFYLRAKAEESILIKHLGEEYLSYRENTPMFIPRFKNKL